MAPKLPSESSFSNSNSMLRYRLRTLLILLAVGPIVLWAVSMFWMAVIAPTIWVLMFGEWPPQNQ